MNDATKSAAAALTAKTTMSAGAGIRNYFSPQHLWSAMHFARLATDFERKHTGIPQLYLQHRGYVVTTISESVAFLEAYINELYEDARIGGGGAARGLNPDVLKIMSEYWRSTNNGQGSTLDKYNLALVFSGLKRIELGTRPGDDVKYLIKLRNWLIHFRPKTISEASPEEVISHVRGRFSDNPLLPPITDDMWFPNYTLGSGCAKWAVESARAFADDFAGAIGCRTIAQLTADWDEVP